jgi:hypothetical protein
MATTSASAEFSIETFRELFERSLLKTYLSQSELARVYQGMEQKNITLLKPLYVILTQAKDIDDGIVRDFASEKDRIVSDLTAEAHAIDRYYAAAPNRKMASDTEQLEKVAAENILKKIN